MKRIIILLMLLLPFVSKAQDIVRNGRNYTKVEQKETKETETGFTYTIKGVVYPIYMGKTGACYIKRTSKKGTIYKQYLGEEISKEICTELGVKYTSKKKTNEEED